MAEQRSRLRLGGCGGGDYEAFSVVLRVDQKVVDR